MLIVAEKRPVSGIRQMQNLQIWLIFICNAYWITFDNGLGVRETGMRINRHDRRAGVL